MNDSAMRPAARVRIGDIVRVKDFERNEDCSLSRHEVFLVTRVEDEDDDPLVSLAFGLEEEGWFAWRFEKVGECEP